MTLKTGAKSDDCFAITGISYIAKYIFYVCIYLFVHKLTECFVLIGSEKI